MPNLVILVSAVLFYRADRQTKSHTNIGTDDYYSHVTPISMLNDLNDFIYCFVVKVLFLLTEYFQNCQKGIYYG